MRFRLRSISETSPRAVRCNRLCDRCMIHPPLSLRAAARRHIACKQISDAMASDHREASITHRRRQRVSIPGENVSHALRPNWRLVDLWVGRYGMAISNLALGIQTLNPVSELADERCELCKSNAAGAILCESCSEMIKRLATIQGKDNHGRAMAATGNPEAIRNFNAKHRLRLRTANGTNHSWKGTLYVDPPPCRRQRPH